KDMPEMMVVESSMMNAVGYHAPQQELHIAFLSGKRYVYEHVPEQVFRDLLSAESKGKYFSQAIRPLYKDFRAL
ncbi:MAG: KTSC domain-containing protein, partial [Fimbriimonas sp.]